MHRTASLLAALSVVAALTTPPASAQANQIPGTDIRLAPLGGLRFWGHSGTFPNGISGFSMTTTACNDGTQNVGWFAPMNENHAMISFLFVRVEGGRMEQISDWSYVKHGFFATNSSGCGSCTNPGGNPTLLFPGCSDTYGTSNNGDNYYLGPPDEIDPWLGTWNSKCSHFDQGEPPVGPPQDCDSARSLTQSQAGQIGPVFHRAVIGDADLDHPGASYYFQAHYVIRGEPEANRDDNLGSRPMTATWNGSDWLVGTSGGHLSGTVLQRWSGSNLSSNTNGGDDGRVYVASMVTGPDVNGLYHYEYAVQNRDNARGIGALRIPVGAGVLVSNLNFRDFDGNTATDWTPTVSGGEIRFSTTSNPLRWNTIYNFWFDSDAAPVDATLNLDQFATGFGSPSIALTNKAPGDICDGDPATYCTPKVNSLGCTPSIASTGAPSASAGSGFLVTASNVINNKSGLFFYGTSGQQSVPFQGGFLCVKAPIFRTLVQNSAGNPPPNDCSGTYSYDFNALIAGGTDPNLFAGAAVDGQYWARDPGFNPPDNTSLTEGLNFTICP